MHAIFNCFDHGYQRTTQRAVSTDATALLDKNRPSPKLEGRHRSACRRNRIRNKEQALPFDAFHQFDAGVMNVESIGDDTCHDIIAFENRTNHPWIASDPRGHRIEQMGRYPYPGIKS